MSKDVRGQFIAAGMKLYPQWGYQKLSVRLLAAEAGVSSGMFHHVFADKDEFVGELLRRKRQQIVGDVPFDFADDVPPVERLRQAIWQLALNVRNHLAWVHRVFADAANQVAVAEAFLRGHFSDEADRFLVLLNQCCQGTQSEQLQRLSYLGGSVLATMILGTRLQAMGVLPDELAVYVPEMLTDEAIAQRIEWAFKALFPQEVIRVAG